MGRLWYILLTMSGEEARAETWLKEHASALETFFPSEVHWRRLPKAGKNKPKKIPVIKAVVPGYLFVRFGADPRFDVIQAKCQHIYGLMKIGDRPIVVTESVLMKMEQVPQHLADMKAERDRLIEEARTFKPGDEADVMGGVFEGWRVTVSGVLGDCVVFDTPLGYAEVNRDLLEKRVS